MSTWSLARRIGDGRAAVTAGQQSVTVPHGLPGMPVHVSVTPIGQPANVGFAITAADAETFTLALAAVQQAEWHFSWFGYSSNGG